MSAEQVYEVEHTGVLPGDFAGNRRAIAAAAAPQFIDHIARELAKDVTPRTFEAYAANFSDDLRVFVDGRELAVGKQAWLTLERGRLGKFNRHVVGYAEGRDNIMVVDEFDDRSGCPPSVLCDPRFITRAARYQFGSDHLIHELRFVQGGGILIPPSRSD